MRRLRLLGMITFLSGSTSLLNLPRKVTTRHRNERFRSLLARCNPLRSALVGPGEGLAEPASNDAIAEPIARSANPLQGLLIAEPFASEAEHVEESGLHLRPSRGWQRRDERPQVGAIHDADPLYLQHAGAGQTVSFGEVNFPRQAPRLRR